MIKFYCDEEKRPRQMEREPIAENLTINSRTYLIAIK